MDKVLVMNVCDGVECKFWRHITIELGLALWLIGEDMFNGQGGDVTVLVHSLSDYFSRIQPTYDNGSCL